jgi:acetyl-CoA carboxylase carboxyl transferase subunit beta
MATSESETSGKAKMTREKRGVPGGLWLRCDDCGETIFRKEAEKLMSVCPQCG